jgi:hypothetical protein
MAQSAGELPVFDFHNNLLTDQGLGVSPQTHAMARYIATDMPLLTPPSHGSSAIPGGLPGLGSAADLAAPLTQSRRSAGHRARIPVPAQWMVSIGGGDDGSPCSVKDAHAVLLPVVLARAVGDELFRHRVSTDASPAGGALEKDWLYPTHLRSSGVPDHRLT